MHSNTTMMSVFPGTPGDPWLLPPHLFSQRFFYSGLQNYQKMDMLGGLCPTLFFRHIYVAWVFSGM